MKDPIIILGAGGLGKAALNIFKSNGVLVFGFLDDELDSGNDINDVPVLGRLDDEDFLNEIGKKCEAFVAIEDASLQSEMIDLLIKKYKKIPVNAIHSSVSLPELINMGHGNFLDAGVVIGANVKLGSHCFIHASAVLDYGSQINDYVKVGPGSVVSSVASLGKKAFLGSGAVIASGVKVGENAVIGPGAVVVKEVEPGQTVYGNPAQPV